MKLTPHERLMLGVLLPSEENMATLRLIRDARERLSFTQDEHTEFGIVVDGPTTTWNPDKDKAVEIDIDPLIASLAKKKLCRLEDEHKLQLAHMSLYEKFVEAPS